MNDSLEKSLKPFYAFNKVVAKTTEAAVTQHLESIEEFTKLGMDNFHSGMKAKTFEDAVKFSKNQPEVMKKTSALLVKRSESYLKLSSQFYKFYQEAFTANLKEMPTTIQEATSKMGYDLGESTVIREPKKKSTPKAKKTTPKSKTSTKKTKAPVKKAKAVTTPKTKKTNTELSKKDLKTVATSKDSKSPISTKQTTKKTTTKPGKVDVPVWDKPKSK